MSTESYKHKDKRKHIPSKEEEGYEKANPLVNEKDVATYAKNPVVHRGQDPELMWMNKYGPDDKDDMLNVDIRSLYRHEHISPEVLIKNLYRLKEDKANPYQLDLNEMFGNSLDMEEMEKVGEYYKHQDGWTNRMILGDSLLVMNSLLEREGMAGKVQMIFFDPPYGIKYGGNWQMKLNDRTVKDGSDEHLSGEPEMIKAYRDTWELGIHSYLSYLRDRFLTAKELLNESGSCFVQISEDNLHLVRSIMDEVFGSENFISLITIQKTSGKTSSYLDSISDYLLLYSKDRSLLKYRKLWFDKLDSETLKRYNYLDLPDGQTIKLSKDQIEGKEPIPEGKRWGDYALHSQGETTGETSKPFEFNGEIFYPKRGRHWSNPPAKLEIAARKGRIVKLGNDVRYKRFADDFPVKPITNIWLGTAIGKEPLFVVQTSDKIIANCILITTDPGDLVLDPTCGSGTTAFVAEQWGRRWITIDTSRIALNIAKTRLMTANYPFYKLYDPQYGDIRQGFIYKKVPHITLKSLANDEPADEETLYDQPEVDNSKMRVSGPFTVETLQSYNPIPPEEAEHSYDPEDNFEEKVFEHLKVAGVKTGRKDEKAVFVRVNDLQSEYLHAEGFYQSATGEKKAYIHIGPKFGTVSKTQVNEAIKECRQRGDADWLVILGFSFESNIQNESVTASMGAFEVTKVRMHDDLMQEGLLKKDKKAASFVTIGEPDIKLLKKDKDVQVEIQGLDIYDPIKDEVKARNIHDIAYWMMDDDYDGSNFVVKQIFFCGGNKDEFSKWQKGLDNMAQRSARKRAETTLKIEIDEDAFERLYGHISHPIPYRKGQKIAVRVISQFGEESMKVLEVN
jgi:adenine-specific DNA-methyltransferase